MNHTTLVLDTLSNVRDPIRAQLEYLGDSWDNVNERAARLSLQESRKTEKARAAEEFVKSFFFGSAS